VELPVQVPAVGAVAPPRAEPPRSGRRGEILVVDDEPVVLEVLAGLLGLEGHRVDTVSSATEALERLAARPYDVIFSDIRMPGLDGPGLYRELSERHPGLVGRSVFVTGDTLSRDVQAFLEQNPVVCLSKPFVFDDLVRVVRRLLGTSA
jgi:CheY-like chemotaxis protein